MNTKEGFLFGIIKKFLIDLGFLLHDSQILLVLMFISMLFGTFALFNGLLRFFFKDSHQFRKKEINVIAFMISFMASSGIFFIFKNNPERMIYTFGGIAGLLLVIFISILILKMFYSLAKEIDVEKKHLAKFWTIFGTGILLASGLLVSYTGLIIQKIGETISSDFNLIKIVYAFSLIVFETVIWVVIIGGIIWFFKKNNDDEDYISDDSSEELKFARERIKNVKSKMSKINGLIEKLNSLYLKGGIEK